MKDNIKPKKIGENIKKKYRLKGKGKEYYRNELIFEGEYNEGRRWNGKGKEYDDDELIFEGEYKEGKRLKGKEYSSGILIFDGEYKKAQSYAYSFKESEYLDGKLIGLKVLNYTDKKGIKSGKEYDADGNLIFDGLFKDGKRWKGEEFGEELDSN